MQDGSGTWDSSTLTWWGGATPDVAWTAGSDAVFGGGSSGTAGTVTVSGTVSANSITFNQPYSGNYTLGGGGGAMLQIASSLTDNVSSGTTNISTGLINFGTGPITLSGTGAGMVQVNGELTQGPSGGPASYTVTGGFWSCTSQGNSGIRPL